MVVEASLVKGKGRSLISGNFMARFCRNIVGEKDANGNQEAYKPKGRSLLCVVWESSFACGCNVFGVIGCSRRRESRGKIHRDKFFL